MSQTRNTTISIAKGIAIILMVVGHTEVQGLLTGFIYLFHMPLFFITAGYFFSRKYVDNPWDFCVKRVKGLYVPFVKWSIFFLILHNVFFHFGILNEAYGNWENGVTHPYTIYSFMQRLVSIVFAMGGYDEFMAGAFWFFRALFLSSILFLVFYKALDGSTRWLRGNAVVAVICGAAVLFGLLKTSMGLTVQTVVQGGIRETMGIFFFGLGVLFHSYQARIKEHWLLALLYLGILIVCAMAKFRGMTLAMQWKDVLTLTATGTIGFLMVHYIAGRIDLHDNILKRFLVHCGDMTLYIYVFHIISFKVVSLVKIWYYGLDPRQIGCHMVIHYHNSDYFWILYSIAGVGLPLLWMWGYRRMRNCLKTRFTSAK